MKHEKCRVDGEIISVKPMELDGPRNMRIRIPSTQVICVYINHDILFCAQIKDVTITGQGLDCQVSVPRSCLIKAFGYNYKKRLIGKTTTILREKDKVIIKLLNKMGSYEEKELNLKEDNF